MKKKMATKKLETKVDLRFLRYLEDQSSETLKDCLTREWLSEDHEAIKQILERREEEERRWLEELKAENPEQYDVEMTGKMAGMRKKEWKERHNKQSEAAMVKEHWTERLAVEQLKQQQLEKERASLQQELRGHITDDHRREVEGRVQKVQKKIQRAKPMQGALKTEINARDKQLQRVSHQQDKELKRLLEEALKDGYIEAQLSKCLMEGLAGAGKSALKRLLLGMAPAILRVSTGCLERPIRAVSGERSIPAVPGQHPIPAVPGERPIPAVPGERPIPTVPGEHPIPAVPGECPIPAVSGEQPIPAVPGERLIRAVSGMRIESSKERWRELTMDELAVMVADVVPLLCDRIACKIELPSDLSEALQKLPPNEDSDTPDTQGEDSDTSDTPDEDLNTSNTQDEATPINSPQPEATPSRATAQEDSPDTKQDTNSTSSPAKLATSTILKSITDRIACEKESGRLFSIPIVHFFDTGGQPPFHEVIPIFSKHPSVAVLVFRLSERLDARPMVEYYDASGHRVGTPHPSPLTSEQVVKVMTRSLQSSQTDGKLPKVIVVGTHKDKESECPSESRQQKNEKLCSILCPVMQDELVFYGESLKELIFPVNTIGRGEEEERIAKMLRQEIEKCSRKVKIPIWWFIFELILRHLAEQLKRRVLSRRQCSEVAHLLGFHENAFNAALKFLNELSILLHYPKILPGVVFTDSQVPVDKVSELIERKYQLQEATEGRQPQKPISGKWVRFRDQGIVALEFLRDFPKHYVDGLFTPDDLVELLTDLLVFAPISDDEYFMPVLLETLSDDELNEHRITSSAASPLLVRFPNGWPRYGVFCCLVVYLINQQQWKVVNSRGTPIFVSRNCMKFKLPRKPCTLVLIDCFSHFELYINAPPSVCRNVCPSIKDAIFTGLNAAVINLGYNNDTPAVAFFCPHSSNGSPPLSLACGSLHTAIVEEYPWWTCAEDMNLHGELNDQQRMWFKDQESNPVPDAPTGQTDKPVQSSADATTAGAIYKYAQERETQKTVQSSVGTTATIHRASSPTLSTEPELVSCGTETQQYQTLLTNFPKLITTLSPMISAEDLADKLFCSARLITKGTWEEASLEGVTNSSKLRKLMKSVLSQVELNAANYDKFVTVLNEFDGLQDVVQLLEPV